MLFLLLLLKVSTVCLAKAEVQEDQAHKGSQDLQDGTPWMKERMTIWEDWCLKQKKEKQPGKVPKNL